MKAAELLTELDDMFGPNALGEAIFYHHSPALRFELTGRGSTPAQFLQAIDRARAVLASAFAGADELTAVLEVWSDRNPAHLYQPAKLWQKAEAALRPLGLTPPAPEHRIVLLQKGDWPRNFFAFSVPTACVPELLWGTFAADLGVTPRLEGRLTLAAPALGILACPYDSRGLDLIGPNAARLAELHTRFGPWLLEYDRPRMAEMFSPQTQT